MPKVLISDKLSPLAVDIFKQRGIDVDFKPGLTPEQLKELIVDYDGLAIRSATKATQEIIEAAPNLKVIGRAGIGTDNIDKQAATANGVVVMNTPFGNSITTAEHAIAMMFALARQIPQASASTHAGKWEKSKFMGVELTGKVLGIIGCGNIGAIVADRALGLKMRVIAYDPFLSPERAKKLGVEKVELEDLLGRSDFITLHVPLTDHTRNILDADALAKTKKQVRIINCARGGLIDEAALKLALETGHVAGAALDVFAEEPATENPLFGLENVVCTPHLGAATTEAQVNVALQIAEQMSDYLLTGAVVNALNMPSVSAEDAPKLKPYMKLAHQMGSFAGQISTSALKAISISYEGAVSTLNTKPITAVLLEGILAPLMDSVNMVNAPVIAKERNIDVSETYRDQASDYQTLIRLELETENGTRSIVGTLFGGEKPRLVAIEDIAVEVELSKYMLFVRNEDKPGFIGALGSTLGQANVNIATFTLGRHDVGASALALISVDQQIEASLLEAVHKLDFVTFAEGLEFSQLD